MKSEQKYYVYAHIRNDTNQIFYIGKGTGDRAWYRYEKRSKHWKNIVKKSGGFQVEILKKFDVESDAFDYEIYMIKNLRDSGFNLANKSNGGEGTSGFKQSDEQKKAHSELQKERYRNNPFVNPMYGKKHTPETIKKLCASKKDIFIGMGHPRATLNDIDVACIYAMKGSMTMKDIAVIFKCSRAVVSNIINGKSWRHITGIEKHGKY